MNQIVAIETPVETEIVIVIATAAGTIETEEKAVIVTEDETVETTDHDRETDVTTRMIAPYHQIITDETVEEIETEAAEIGAEDETATDERVLAGTTIEMIVMAITETEDVRSLKKISYPILANHQTQQTIATTAAAQPLLPPTHPPSPPVLIPKMAPEKLNPTPQSEQTQEALHLAAIATATPDEMLHPHQARWTRTSTTKTLRLRVKTMMTDSPPCRP
jgi:hypothetical protein